MKFFQSDFEIYLFEKLNRVVETQILKIQHLKPG